MKWPYNCCKYCVAAYFFICSVKPEPFSSLGKFNMMIFAFPNDQKNLQGFSPLGETILKHKPSNFKEDIGIYI